MLNNDPDWDPELFAGETPPLLRPLDLQVRERGAPGRGRRDHHPHRRRRPATRGRWCRPPGAASSSSCRAEGEPRIQVRGWATEDAARKLMALGRPRPGRAGRSGAKRATSGRCRSASPPRCASRNKICADQTANVARPAPRQRPEARATRWSSTPRTTTTSASASRTRPATRIYNGALDNASGVAQVLAIAKAFKALPEPPRRSILFAVRRPPRSRACWARSTTPQHPTVAARQDRRQHQLRRRQHLRPHHRPRLHRLRQVRPRRGGRSGRARGRAAR